MDRIEVTGTRRSAHLVRPETPWIAVSCTIRMIYVLEPKRSRGKKARPAIATGTVSEKDGKKWLTATKLEAVKG